MSWLVQDLENIAWENIVKPKPKVKTYRSKAVREQNEKASLGQKHKTQNRRSTRTPLAVKQGNNGASKDWKRLEAHAKGINARKLKGRESKGYGDVLPAIFSIIITPPVTPKRRTSKQSSIGVSTKALDSNHLELVDFNIPADVSQINFADCIQTSTPKKNRREDITEEEDDELVTQIPSLQFRRGSLKAPSQRSPTKARRTWKEYDEEEDEIVCQFATANNSSVA
ncbi:hypothetical protein SJAG_04630 [Schizosaccharomyces japonicus yFS275]|uniref:Uncharacterized protein n=1 Tax=Schizosaccharomyces japonicus (strain yFS275 / FY16936) TaxID=402676 RepID=B6K7C2_SCHJY|nr:hypothetical protein SJAG_04630 [Schizosaccharomyces japonicus yFS275]EEB09426.1 hypothetical protein SJAG_04630 [Schizosaccharomyces japonicus yFS275]